MDKPLSNIHSLNRVKLSFALILPLSLLLGCGGDKDKPNSFVRYPSGPNDPYYHASSGVIPRALAEKYPCYTPEIFEFHLRGGGLGSISGPLYGGLIGTAYPRYKYAGVDSSPISSASTYNTGANILYIEDFGNGDFNVIVSVCSYPSIENHAHTLQQERPRNFFIEASFSPELGGRGRCGNYGEITSATISFEIEQHYDHQVGGGLTPDSFQFSSPMDCDLAPQYQHQYQQEYRQRHW